MTLVLTEPVFHVTSNIYSCAVSIGQDSASIHMLMVAPEWLVFYAHYLLGATASIRCTTTYGELYLVTSAGCLKLHHYGEMTWSSNALNSTGSFATITAIAAGMV